MLEIQREKRIVSHTELAGDELRRPEQHPPNARGMQVNARRSGRLAFLDPNRQGSTEQPRTVREGNMLSRCDDYSGARGVLSAYTVSVG